MANVKVMEHRSSNEWSHRLRWSEGRAAAISSPSKVMAMSITILSLWIQRCLENWHLCLHRKMAIDRTMEKSRKRLARVTSMLLRRSLTCLRSEIWSTQSRVRRLSHVSTSFCTHYWRLISRILQMVRATLIAMHRLSVIANLWSRVILKTHALQLSSERKTSRLIYRQRGTELIRTGISWLTQARSISLNKEESLHPPFTLVPLLEGWRIHHLRYKTCLLKRDLTHNLASNLVNWTSASAPLSLSIRTRTWLSKREPTHQISTVMRKSTMTIMVVKRIIKLLQSLTKERWRALMSFTMSTRTMLAPLQKSSQDSRLHVAPLLTLRHPIKSCKAAPLTQTLVSQRTIANVVSTNS